MSAPRRLLADEGTPQHVRELLADWMEHEQPGAAARQKTLAALGLATGGVAATNALAGAATITPKAAGGVLLWLKPAVIGAAVIGASIGTYALLAPRPQNAAPASQAVARTVPDTLAAPHAETAPVVDVAALPSATAPSLPRSAPLPVPHPSEHRATTSPGSADALARELALVDGARAALDRGDASRALSLLDDYGAQFPRGTFAQEADVLRVDALLRRGDRATATDLAQRFLVRYPRSPHAARLRALLSSAP